MKTFNLGDREEAVRVRVADYLRRVGEAGFEGLLHDLEKRTKTFRAFFAYERFGPLPAEDFRKFLWEHVWAFRDLGEEEGRRAFAEIGSPKIKESLYTMLERHRQASFNQVWAPYVAIPFDGAVLTEILMAHYPDVYPCMNRRSVEGLGKLLDKPAAEIAAWPYVRMRAHADDLWQLFKEQPEYGHWTFNQNYNYPYVDAFLAEVWEGKA
ncbi:MAG: hypothetical protein K8I02_07705 [Candidatus Methylomirabilis sp.]|nr:hypothetical protein [Deltaproteobacteria bacterium]